MALAIKPISCNGGCRSCYEAKIRSGHPHVEIADFAKVKETLVREMAKDTKGEWQSPTLHGGEPLLMPYQEIESLLGIIFDKYGKTGIQTNGVLISDRHVELFRKFKTHVGISLDGDTAETNRGRWNDKDWSIGSMTEIVLSSMAKLKREGIGMSIICLLRKYNASLEKIPSLATFLTRLHNEFGIKNIRLNPVTVYEKEHTDEELSNDELAEAYRALFNLEAAIPELDLRPMKDFHTLLSGGTNATCSFVGCDVWCTQSETPIFLDGSLGKCRNAYPRIDCSL